MTDEELRAKIAREMPSVLERTYMGPPDKKGRQKMWVMPYEVWLKEQR